MYVSDAGGIPRFPLWANRPSARVIPGTATGTGTDKTPHPDQGPQRLRTAQAIVIAEGYATAGSISDAIGHATWRLSIPGTSWPWLRSSRINIRVRPYSLRETMTGISSTIRSEGKPRTRENGKGGAGRGGKAVFPAFAPGEREKDMAGFTDFSDLARKSRLGMAAVARQLKPAIEKAIKEQAVEFEKNKQLVHSRSEGISR